MVKPMGGNVATDSCALWSVLLKTDFQDVNVFFTTAMFSKNSLPLLTIMEKLGPYVALSVKRKCAPGPGRVLRVSSPHIWSFAAICL